MGFIYLYTGTGARKTANTLGLALRSVGHKKKVVISTVPQVVEDNRRSQNSKGTLTVL